MTFQIIKIFQLVQLTLPYFIILHLLIHLY
uniref:Uncharacterized protein n=1 Tax=Anguilla anguilla TaxID=7936 RepID=A0A0E9PRI4_ANGAN